MLNFEEEPQPKPQPCKILCRAGKPVYEIISNPEPRPLSQKAARKVETSKRLQEEAKEQRCEIIRLLKTQGAQGATDLPNRKWSSLRPNENYLNAYASGTFGNPLKRQMGFWDRQAYEDAKEVLLGWKGSVKGATANIGNWVPIPSVPTFVPTDRAYKSVSVSEGISLAVTKGRMDKGSINQAYAQYALSPESEAGNLEAAMYAFAPKDGRWGKCDKLLKEFETDIEPDDIIGEFYVYLLERFRKGQYAFHDGRFHHWIGHVWGRWFFPEFKTDFYKRKTSTRFLKKLDLEDHEETLVPEVNTVYDAEVDRQAAKRDVDRFDPARSPHKIFRDLDDPSTIWGRVSPQGKEMLRELARGASKEQAAAAAGICPRQGRRLLKSLRDELLSGSVDTLQAVAADVDAHPDSTESVCPPLACGMRVYGEDGSRLVLNIQGAAASSLDTITRSLDTAEASEMLGVRPATLRGWKAQRIGPPFIQLSPRCVRYAESDILQYANERRVVPSVRERGETS